MKYVYTSKLFHYFKYKNEDERALEGEMSEKERSNLVRIGEQNERREKMDVSPFYLDSWNREVSEAKGGGVCRSHRERCGI